MTSDTEEGIRFHKLLADVRRQQGKTLKQVASGVYSIPMMKRIETGERRPRKLERDRILARLGISRERYVDYLSCREYDQWQIRQDIVRSVKVRDVVKLEAQLAEYERIEKRTNLEKQFLEAMRFMLLRIKGASEDELRRTIKRAVSYTIPNIEEGLQGKLLLAEQEVYLLREYARLHDYEGTEERKNIMQNLELSYIEKFCNLYREIDCYCINDVIRTRRKQMGLSRRQLAEGICSEKTIERLENQGTMVQMYEVKRLFERLEIPGDGWIIG